MRNYILESNTDQYMQCMELQKTAILKVIEDKVILRETIVDFEGGILLCPAGEYYDGKCHAEIDTIKIPSEYH